jgi:alkanesulfonate monooxygenase SsuD/methylene tetrahydromethanopterin reductase-like flavin-dependent oxidoreductase (luciferase family)
MRIGVFLPAARFPGMAAGEVLANTVEAVVAAEAAGFDDAWIAEHHFMSYGVCPSAVTLAAVALGRTSRIQVGTAVSVLSTQHPVALAEQAAVLHHASGGRFRLGVGRGGPWIDLEVFGTGIERFEYGWRESLDLLCAALSGETISADGEFFRFREVPMVPAASMRPVVACTSEPTVTLAAERGLPMLLGMQADDDEKAALIAKYDAVAGRTEVRHVAEPVRHVEEPVRREAEVVRREAAAPSRRAGGGAAGQAEKAGRRLAGVGAVRHVAAGVGFVADSTAQAVRELTRAMPSWLGPGLAGYVPVDGRTPPRRDISRYVELLCRIHPVGSPEHCMRTISRTAERTGLRHLILMVEGAGDHNRTLENITRFGAEVLPGLRQQSTSSGF